MNNVLLGYAMESLADSVETVSNSFLDTANQVAGQIANSLGFLAEGFIHSVKQTRDGMVDVFEGVTGIIIAPIAIALILIGIPLIVLAWLALFVGAAIAHTASVPLAYIWCLYQKFREALKPLPVVSIDYFPEVFSKVEIEQPILTPPVLVLSAIALIADMGIEVEPAPQAWTPSYIPTPQEEVQVPQVETIDVEAFRRGLEQQFAPEPRQTWKEYILQNLVFPEVYPLEKPLALIYPQCEINPIAQIEIVQEPTVRETVSPFPTPTTSCSGEVERSLPLEVSIALEFPARPDDRVLQRWGKEQLVAFCDRINAVKRGSITKYKKASKTLLVKKIKEFYV